MRKRRERKKREEKGEVEEKEEKSIIKRARHVSISLPSYINTHHSQSPSSLFYKIKSSLTSIPEFGK